MIGERETKEILTQYAKHGWNLRRVLLSAEMFEKLPAAMFGTAEIVAAEINALWFSRASGSENEAWELRLLSNSPFALIEVFEADDEEAVREEIRSEMETILREKASNVGNQKAIRGN